MGFKSQLCLQCFEACLCLQKRRPCLSLFSNSNITYGLDTMMWQYLRLLDRTGLNMNNLCIGHKRRLGLIGAKRTTITVHRSEEVLPQDSQNLRRLVRQGTSMSSEGDTDAAVLEDLAAKEQERWELIPFLKGVDSLRGCWFDNSLAQLNWLIRVVVKILINRMMV